MTPEHLTTVIAVSFCLFLLSGIMFSISNDDEVHMLGRIMFFISSLALWILNIAVWFYL